MAIVNESLNAAFQQLIDRQPDVAEHICRQLLNAEPNNSNAEFLLGKALSDQGRTSDAMIRFERALSLRPVLKYHVIQAAITRLAATTYLEIGVAQGENLVRISAPTKIGIDPASPSTITGFEVRTGRAAYFPMTSDEFFATSAHTALSSGLDVAFIDGLHTYGQTLTDVENCLKYLNEGGVILMHDCNPTSEATATPASCYEDALAMNPPGWNGTWTGDVWKTILHVRSRRRDLRACVLDCHFGVGVISRGAPDEALPDLPEQIANLSYADLDNNRGLFLGLRPPQELLQIITTEQR